MMFGDSEKMDGNLLLRINKTNDNSRDDYLRKKKYVETRNPKDEAIVQAKSIFDFGIFTVIKFGYYGVHIVLLTTSVIMNILSGITLLIKPTGPAPKYGPVWWME